MHHESDSAIAGSQADSCPSRRAPPRRKVRAIGSRRASVPGGACRSARSPAADTRRCIATEGVPALGDIGCLLERLIDALVERVTE